MSVCPQNESKVNKFLANNEKTTSYSFVNLSKKSNFAKWNLQIGELANWRIDKLTS